ncbi:MAG: M13 family metallopeptidase [Prevotellaceae bacterium]|nr:M13 family metallopeptidase [Candidatus Minthosoma equi]
MQHGINKANMDLTVNPGTDFHQYATGHWLDNNPRNEEYPSWNNFSVVQDKVRDQLEQLIRGLMAEECTSGSASQKARDLYTLYCDADRLNREGFSPILPLYEKIDSIKTNQEFVDFLAQRHSGMMFFLGFGPNVMDSSHTILYVVQGIHNPDDYLSDNPKVLETREIRKQYRVNLLKMIGKTEDEAKQDVELYWSLLTELARESLTLVEQRDPEKSTHIMSIDELQALTPEFDWKRHLEMYSLGEAKEVDVQSIKATQKACKMYMELPLDTLKMWLKIRIITGSSRLLSDDFFNEDYDCCKKLYGDYKQKPREKRAIDAVIGTLNEVISQVYVEKYFPKENKEKVLSIVENLRDSFAERIKEQAWMSEETKQKALHKLSCMKVKIGYPDKWDDMSGLVVDPSLSLFENSERIGEFFWQMSKEKYFNKPVDKTEWHMAPIQVNACFSPIDNDITFPAAILQAPFFDMEADDAVNLGAIGVVISHEMTHGFDDSGRKYDENGNLNEWWTEEDAKAFGKVCDRMSAFHDKIEALPGLNCNGKLTLGEDIADHGGITIAFNALQHVMEEQSLETIDGMTPQQRFFISYAQNWAGYSPEESLRQRTLNDPHSIPSVRTNAGVQHINEWYDAFNVKEDEKLYISPEERVSIW